MRWSRRIFQSLFNLNLHALLTGHSLRYNKSFQLKGYSDIFWSEVHFKQTNNKQNKETWNCCHSVLGPIVGGLSNRIGCRIVVMLGGILFCLGLVFAALANNVIWLTFCLCILVGKYYSHHFQKSQLVGLVPFTCPGSYYCLYCLYTDHRIRI